MEMPTVLLFARAAWREREKNDNNTNKSFSLAKTPGHEFVRN